MVAYSDQEMGRLEAEGSQYLHEVAARVGLRAEYAVRFGDAADEILHEAKSSGADLVALPTSGKSGLKRMVMGSVAEQVFRQAPVPVLLYHPTAVSG